MTATATANALRLKRTFAASPERVFRAWTDPAALRLWFAPGDYTVPSAEADPTVGGHYRIQMRAPNGNVHEVAGVYKVVDSPRRLVFTWAWQTKPEVEMLVTVDFRADGDSTEVTLTHEQLPDEDSMRKHEHGWLGCLAKLPAALEQKGPNMRMVDAIIAEMEQEAAATRRVLDRVPEDKLGWKPHAKSMSLGQLAMHIATINGGIAGLGANDTFDMTEFRQPEAGTKAEILAAFDGGLAKAKEMLNAVDDARAMSPWSLLKEGKAVLTMPRIGLYRAILCNHQYHHRGQLTVYLRMLDVPLPSVYGPSADENPF